MAYKNPENEKKYLEIYRETHREQAKTYNRTYYVSHHKQILAQKKAYYETHKKEHASRSKLYEFIHKEERQNWRKGYRRSHRDLFRSLNATREAHKRNAFVEKVDIAEVYRRGHGTCGICHKKVSRKDFSLDHILPLSKGGEHSYRNVQVAHRSCNSRKRDRAIIPQQLKLV